MWGRNEKPQLLPPKTMLLEWARRDDSSIRHFMHFHPTGDFLRLPAVVEATHRCTLALDLDQKVFFVLL